MRPEYENLRIRTLAEALDRANEKVEQLERALVDARRAHEDM